MHHIPAAASPAVAHARIAPPADPQTLVPGACPRDQRPEASPPVECSGAGPHAAPASALLPEGGGTGPLPGVRRRGDPNLAPRCGAKARTTGCACRAPAMANGRCRMHGGRSTGPRTAEGFTRLAAARTTHGNSGAAKRAEQRYWRTLTARMRVLTAVVRLQGFLPTALAARLTPVPAELSKPAHPAELGETEISDRTPCNHQPSGGAPAVAERGRRAKGPRPPRGQAAERAAARTERAALAPWRVGIARARLVKRVVLAAWRKERAEKRRQDPMHPRAAGAERAAARKPHATLDGAGMGVVASALPLRGSRRSASRPNPANSARGEGSGGVTSAPGGADSAGRSRQEFRAAREEPMHPTTRRWPLGGWKGRLCSGTDLSSAALDVADAGGWGVVIAACEAAEAGQAGQAGTAGAVGKVGRR